MSTEYEALARELRWRQSELLAELTATENDLHTLGEERESEWSESAVEERQRHLLSSLDGHERETLGEVEAALQRIEDGSYGRCEHCQVPISFARLQVLPTARSCAACAETATIVPAADEDTDTEEVPESGPIPSDFLLMTDEEIEEAIWEQIHTDGRIETEELHLTCREGVVFLTGALPSRAQQSILVQLITDVLGFQEVVDRTEVEQLAWQREDRDKAPAESVLPLDPDEKEESSQELYGSEDIIESEGEVLTEPAPLGQPAPEEE